MTPASRLTFKIASEPWELEAVHRLNYRTFVEEIPQHRPDPGRRLVDRYHAENTYAIALDADRLVGMVAGRAVRPFSLDEKLADLDSYLPPGRRVLEIRLLAVEREARRGPVFARLAGLLASHFRAQGYDLAVISATIRQLRLYRHLGFETFGPRVGTPAAPFQPMLLTLERYERVAAVLEDGGRPRRQWSFLPGPVEIHPAVRRAFARAPVSHRAAEFVAAMRDTQRRLRELTGASRVEVLLGSGTLANEAVAAQLALAGAPGLVVGNGEFGARLVDHARRWGLRFAVHEFPWGEPVDVAAVARRLDGLPETRWLWAVHCETSTGVLNDLAALVALCGERRIDLCLDCVSSLGAVPVDLRGVRLATAVSGKALGAYPGLALVFHREPLRPAPGIPRYLDLGEYGRSAGVPFTHSSNLLAALRCSLERVDWPERLRRVAEASAWLRARLRRDGWRLVAAEAHASPAVVTLDLPRAIPSRRVGRQLARAGYLLSYRSAYLLERNWIQVCLMGEWTRPRLEALVAALAAARQDLESPLCGERG